MSPNCGNTIELRQKNAGAICGYREFFGVNSYCVVEDTWGSWDGEEYNPISSCLPADHLPECAEHPYKICRTCDNNRHETLKGHFWQGQCPNGYKRIHTDYPGYSHCEWQINICQLQE